MMQSGVKDRFASVSQHTHGYKITETRQTGLFRATFKRGHEVGRAQKPPSNRPKSPIFGVSRK
jgi:hypothetical protein